MMYLAEIRAAAEILELLEGIQSIEDGKIFIRTYIKAINSALTQDQYDPLDTAQIIKFIIQCDSRFGNMI